MFFWKSKEDPLREAFLSDSHQGYTSVSGPAEPYNNQLWSASGCRQEELLIARDEKD